MCSIAEPVYIGQLMAMALGQDGSGFPYFSRSVYLCLCGLSPNTITGTVDDVPDYEVCGIIQQVFHSLLNGIACWNHNSVPRLQMLKIPEPSVQLPSTTLMQLWNVAGAVATLDLCNQEELKRVLCVHHIWTSWGCWRLSASQNSHEYH